MALNNGGRTVVAVGSTVSDGVRSRVETLAWVGLYAVLALGLTLLGIVAAVALVTALSSGLLATVLLFVAFVVPFAAGPVLARRAVQAAYARVEARRAAPGLAGGSRGLEPVVVDEAATLGR